MNTAGGNEWEVDYNAARAEASEAGDTHFYLPPRDPSVRDVLARLDQIEAKIDALNARMDADEVARG